MAQREKADMASGGQQSKGAAAREQASATGQKAMQAGSGVAQGAMAQGRETAAEGKQQARNLLGEASSQLREQAGTQQMHAAQRLRALGDELQSMSGEGEQYGMAGDLARQGADRAHRAADWLEHREPGAVVEEVRNYARRHPGMFLAGAALAGMLAGRMTRNLAGGSDGASDQQNPPSGRPAVSPMPPRETSGDGRDRATLPDGRTGARGAAMSSGYPRDEVER
jgi:hypothetical protein